MGEGRASLPRLQSRSLPQKGYSNLTPTQQSTPCPLTGYGLRADASL